MKTLITLLVFPMVVLAAIGLVFYQLVASIPSWLLVVVIAYLLYRLHRRSVRPARARDVTGRRPVPVQQAWTPHVAAPTPTVVYLVAPDRARQRDRVDTPEPWILN
ncbi:hypothetical protein [Mycolicibacterium mageritense]|uniref:hypothetical protein n=1 Tax=Mycolicibacterium mageritense TaxID=53462 RepID=UPI0011D63762|nr:hypothetical protein [Mycolicibacterium mageritense]TXI56450.1 MAG: hypothetical protein E6Q55_28710 [Mycolicibacterium mageritense]